MATSEHLGSGEPDGLAPSASTPTTPSLDMLAADRAACPDRYVADPLLAGDQRAYRCVRRALERACAALADLGCELRLEP